MGLASRLIDVLLSPKALWDRLAAYGSFLRSFFRRRSYVVAKWAGNLPITAESRRVAVFVHFDRRGDVHPYVLRYLEQLAKAGFRTVFVTNGPKLTEAARGRVAPYCATIVRRRNVGYDFGAYKEGMAHIPDLSSRDTLILCNDSVYGPLFDLDEVLRGMSENKADVWSATDNWDIAFHLQSYFLVFHRAALGSEAFKKFWRNLRFVESKTWIVHKYEVGLTQMLLRAGLRCNALCPYRDAAADIVDAVRRHDLLADPEPTGSHAVPIKHQDGLDSETRGYLRRLYGAIDRGVPLNATHFFWDHLIIRMRCPFIKRDLLVGNTMRIPFLTTWDRVVRENTPYDPDLILDHLKLVSRNRAV